jgi:hypothetical protein
MSTSRLYVSLVIAIVVCVLLSAGAAWGVSSLVLAGDKAHAAAGAAGVNGKDGTNGKNGADGKDGATGATGATGAIGATGAKGAPGPANGPKGDTGAAGTNGTDGTNGTNGTNGINGVDGAQGPPGVQGEKGDKGDKGDTGAPGASAPTYSVTPADGQFLPIGVTPVATLVGPVPAGPALVGFSLQLLSPFGTVSVSCELVNSTTGDVIIPASTQVLAPGTNTLFAGTQVASLPVDSALTAQCDSAGIALPTNYSNVSVYAISFASS